MDRKQMAHWAAIAGLVTAVVGLGTGFATIYQKWQESESQAANDRREALAKLDQTKDQIAGLQQQIVLERARADAVAQAANKVQVCEGHSQSMQQIDNNFDDLYRDHGQLMSAMRSCGHEHSSDDQQKCAAAVCAVAYWWTSGQSNCIDVATQVAAMRDRAIQERDNAQRDNCAVKSSAAATYFTQ